MTRAALFRWIGWFSAVNVLLFVLIAQRYLWLYTFPDDFIGIAYALLTLIGHMTVLVAVPMFVLLSPVVLLTRSWPLTQALAVVIAALGLSLLLLDTNVFAEHRFHLGLLTAALFETSTWLFVGLLFVIFLAFQAMLSGLVWQKTGTARGLRHGGKVAAVLLGSWLASQAIHIWGDAVGHVPVTQFTRYMPFYFPIHAKRDLARLGLVDPEQVRQQRMLRGSINAAEGPLQYPLEPLACAPEKPLPNIVIIMIDGLRPDVIVPELMPQIAGFREGAVVFNQQFSGGNSSRMGLFSLFYGLPSTYWQSFYDLQRGPVLMEVVKENDYRAGLFSAAGFGSPALIDRTAFAGWPDLADKRNDLSAYERNVRVTDDWLAWLDNAAADRPLFGFLYYDPPAGEVPDDGAQALPLESRYTDDARAVELWRDYRLAMRMIDAEVGRVFDGLRARNKLAESLVMIVSDHGFEFNDNGVGHYGHASNFSPIQLRSTLVVRWPGKSAGSIDYRTTHHDVPVTLLQEVFGCTNAPSDYSVGRNLFSGEPWQWMMAGSYTSHAIVEPERIIVSHPGGFVEILGSDWRPAADRKLDGQLIQDTLEAQQRFLK